MGNESENRGGRIDAWLRDHAPKHLNDFAACTESELELDVTQLDWIPDGPFGDLSPDLQISPGPSPNTATISYGPLISIPISLSTDGELVADTASLPESGPLDFIEESAQQWVAAFNARLRENHNKLETLSVAGGKLTAKKHAVAAPVSEEPPPESAPALVGAAGIDASPSSEPTPAEIRSARDQWWERRVRGLEWRGLVLVFGALGAFLIFLIMLFTGAIDLSGGGDADRLVDEIAVSDPQSTEFPLVDQLAATLEPRTTEPPATEPPATVPPATAVPTDVPTRIPAPTVDPLANFREVRPSQPAGIYGSDLGYLGERLVSVVDASGDVVGSVTGQPADNLAAEIDGLVLRQEGSTIWGTVLMRQDPSISRGTFSWAVLLAIQFSNGDFVVLVWEVHDGVESVGELTDDGIVPVEGVTIELVDGGVEFHFEVPDGERVTLVGARAFNTLADGEEIASDELIVENVPASPPPAPTGPLLGTVDLVTQTWTLVVPGVGPLPPFQFGPPGETFFHPFLIDLDGDGAAVPGYLDPSQGELVVAEAFGAGELRVVPVQGLGSDDFVIAVDPDGDGAESVGIVDAEDGSVFVVDELEPDVEIDLDSDDAGRRLSESPDVGFIDENGNVVNPAILPTGGDRGVGIRGDWNGDGLETAAGFLLSNSSYVIDDRHSFADGFESGDTAVWSSSRP